MLICSPNHPTLLGKLHSELGCFAGELTPSQEYSTCHFTAMQTLSGIPTVRVRGCKVFFYKNFIIFCKMLRFYYHYPYSHCHLFSDVLNTGYGRWTCISWIVCILLKCGSILEIDLPHTGLLSSDHSGSDFADHWLCRITKKHRR